MTRSRAAVTSQIGTVNTARLNESRMRLRHHARTPYERVFSAMVDALKRGDYETALRLKGELREVKGGEG